MRQHKYILDKQGNPQPEPDVLKWAPWFEEAVKDGLLLMSMTRIGDTRIDTVFTSLDLNFLIDGPAILWQTVVTGGPLDGESTKCGGLRRDAEAMHAKMVARVQDEGKPGKKQR